ncbi:MAG: GAF domain-containing protein, partial [Gammaproteobacteria bacterium]|nr:GAF domain-containing protein [Gammaproteobacteria bacterium]
GLPGKAWSTAQPQIITDLEHSYFQRKDAAKEIGITAGIAIPVFSGEFLVAVTVLLFGGKASEFGAIELWSAEANGQERLSLVDGYYGKLKNLENSSRCMKFNRGQGLPGMVWNYNFPMLVAEPATSNHFIRAGDAAIDNVTTALGFPYNNRYKDFVVSVLSSGDTPIARRFEIWMPDPEHKYLFLHSAKCDKGTNLTELYKNKKIKRGNGLKGRVWLTGCPAISTDLVADELVFFYDAENYKCALVMPVIENAFLKSLIVFVF